MNDEKLADVLREFDERLFKLVQAVEVLGQIVKLQGSRIERLEDTIRRKRPDDQN